MKRANSSNSGKQSPLRQDSGYYSNDEGDSFPDDDIAPFMSSERKTKASVPKPTNTTKLEFSNYAQVDLKRRGTKGSKRYGFEYWGSSYNWKRVTTKDRAGKSVSYHLVKDDSDTVVAHIVPELLSSSEKLDEEKAGGWVPPCSMWISDSRVLKADTDVADVIIATGLIALVDDCIKRHFKAALKPKPTRQVSIEFMGPKAIVEHVFRRQNSSDKEKEIHAHKQSPLRFSSPLRA